jgi:hypothetical protein
MKTSGQHAPTVVVFDAANISTLARSTVHIARLQSAMAYFETMGIRCIAFAPGYWLKSRGWGTPRSHEKETAHDPQQRCTVVESEMATIKKVQEMVDYQKLVLTPPQTHDDLFMIDYAIKHDGYIVTNDMFRDHILNKVSQACVSVECGLSSLLYFLHIYIYICRK